MTFSPDGANATGSRPGHVTPAVPEGWCKDATDPNAGDGTIITASFLNQIIGNLRALVMGLGGELVDGSDTMLIDAVGAAVNDKAPIVHTHPMEDIEGLDELIATTLGLDSPAFTGTPTAPTPTQADDSDRLATTAFVHDNTAGVNAAILLKAPLASPELTGTPLAPTPGGADNSTKIATTAFVQGLVAGGVVGSANRGHLFGLTISNNGTDAVNDIDIAAGVCAERLTPYALMELVTGNLTKRLDAAWTVGDDGGGLDTGAIANTTYHVYLIQRPDTGVVDACFSTNASAPVRAAGGGAVPDAYTRYRRIGSITRAAATIRPFTQIGNEFLYVDNYITEINGATGWVSHTLLALAVPIGISVRPILSYYVTSLAGSSNELSIGDGFGTLASAAYGAAALSAGGTPSSRCSGGGPAPAMTNTNAQIRQNRTGTNSGGAFYLYTNGFIDTRGRFE